MINLLIYCGLLSLSIWQFLRAERHKADSKYFEGCWKCSADRAEENYQLLVEVRQQRYDLRNGMKELLKK